MLRLLGLGVLLTGVFGAGYLYGVTYGTRPLGIFEQPVKTLSQTLIAIPSGSSSINGSLSDKEDLRRQQGLIEAKSRIVQAKSELFQKNTKEAVKELAEAVDSLENTSGKAAGARTHVQEVIGKILQTRSDLLQGRKVTASKMDEIQKEVDVLLHK